MKWPILHKWPNIRICNKLYYDGMKIDTIMHTTNGLAQPTTNE